MSFRLRGLPAATNINLLNPKRWHCRNWILMHFEQLVFFARAGFFYSFEKFHLERVFFGSRQRSRLCLKTCLEFLKNPLLIKLFVPFIWAGFSLRHCWLLCLPTPSGWLSWTDRRLSTSFSDSETRWQLLMSGDTSLWFVFLDNLAIPSCPYRLCKLSWVKR